MRNERVALPRLDRHDVRVQAGVLIRLPIVLRHLVERYPPELLRRVRDRELWPLVTDDRGDGGEGACLALRRARPEAADHLPTEDGVDDSSAEGARHAEEGLRGEDGRGVVSRVACGEAHVLNEEHHCEDDEEDAHRAPQPEQHHSRRQQILEDHLLEDRAAGERPEEVARDHRRGDREEGVREGENRVAAVEEARVGATHTKFLRRLLGPKPDCRKPYEEGARGEEDGADDECHAPDEGRVGGSD